MAESELDGGTLGQKHRNYNKLVQDAVESNRPINVEDFNSENCDMINLFNVDLACHQKNVEYILKIFTCDDMLLISRALTRSNWLIADQKYSNIMNPKYLKTSMFPRMSSKAKCKLIKHIRNNLNDEKRAEEFYSDEEDPEKAMKWLPNCSLEFIQLNVVNHLKYISTSLLKRLCEKSISVLEIYIKNDAAHNKRNALQANMFLLKSNTDKYLDLVEAVSKYEYPTFNKKATSFLMKNSSSRILNKFADYYDYIHLPTFITCLKQENIKDFLIDQAQKLEQNHLYRIFNLKRLLLFIQLMPKEIRFDFVKLVFIDKKHLDSKAIPLLSEDETKGMNKLCEMACNYFRFPEHIWYQFAPFDVAFQKIKDLMGSASSVQQKESLLEVLLTSAQHNLTHERIFLEYLRDKKKNLNYRVKEKIINKTLSKHNFLKYDQSTWNVLDEILKNTDIYSKSENQQSKIVESILLFRVIHDEKVPNIIENKFDFNSLRSYHTKLTEREKEMVFNYLYGLIKTKLEECNPTSETEFNEKIVTLEKALYLLKHFKKELLKYPYLINTIKDMIKLKNSNSSWAASMEKIFNINKTWRRLLFEDSLMLCPTESALLNALKHDPTLLERNKLVVQNILSNGKVAFKHVLAKIKIYWYNSLAKNITLTYIEKLNELGDHKATTLGLSIMLSRQELQELIEKYAPKDAKVNWDKIDEIELSVQQQFAKNMHNARPQPYPDTLLWFAKGDYLQYALPSLLSIFYNLNSISSSVYIPKLLDAPVSLQKHGIRFAVSKMDIGELVSIFTKIWKNNKNASIRSVMFKSIYEFLCKEKDPSKIETAWELLELFIDDLTYEEDKAIYKLLFEVKNVPLAIRGRFYMKCYNFLLKLVCSDKKYEEFKETFYTSFATYSIEIMDQLHPHYIPEIITDFINREFIKGKVVWNFSFINLISSFVLNSIDDESQIERYEKVLLPILKQCIALWTAVDSDGERYIICNLTAILNQLRRDVQNCNENNKRKNPHKIFLLIQEVLEKSLKPQENYILLTKWKLTTLFTNIISKHQPIVNWEESCKGIATEFGDKCNDYLKEDCDKYFPRIYLLFAKALNSMLDSLVPVIVHYDIYKCLINRENFIQGYLTVIKLIPKYPPRYEPTEKEIEQKSQELLKIVKSHSAAEIKIHYYNKFLKVES